MKTLRELKWYMLAAAGIGALLVVYPRINQAAHAQSPRPQEADTGSNVTYKIGSIRFIQSRHIAELTQGVEFHHDTATMKMGSATAFLGEDQSIQSAQSETPVRIYDDYNDITGDKGYIDFRHHLARLVGNVQIHVKPSKADATAPKSSLRSRFKGTAVLNCEQLTYDYRAKFTTIPGTLTVHHQNRTLTSDMGTFDSRTEIVNLIGNVRGHDSLGDELHGPSAVMHVREGEEEVKLNGDVTGVFKVNDLSNDSTAPSGTAQPTNNTAKPNQPPTVVPKPATATVPPAPAP